MPLLYWCVLPFTDGVNFKDTYCLTTMQDLGFSHGDWWVGGSKI